MSSLRAEVFRPYDAGFGSQLVRWDDDLIEGYKCEFLMSADANDGSGGFFALRDWDVVRRLASDDYDVLWVHGYTYLTLLLAILTARATRRPVLLREEQTLSERRPLLKSAITAVLPYEGAIEVERHPGKRHENSGVVVLGWVGNGASQSLSPLLPALARVCAERDVVLSIVSQERFAPAELGSGVIWQQWRLEREFGLLEDFDVGFMPLDDTRYNRGKEALKNKEYMAAGLPVVCSPVGHNLAIVEAGNTGIFACTSDEWFEALVRLVDDPLLRARLGQRARAVRTNRWSLSARVPELAQLARSLVEEAI